MKSAIVKRSIILSGHNTSVSLEDAFWEGLKDIAKNRRTTLSDLTRQPFVGVAAVRAQSLSDATA